MTKGCEKCGMEKKEVHLAEEGQDAPTIKFASLVILLSLGGWVIILILAALVAKRVWGA